MFVLDELVLHLLLQIISADAQLRQAINHVLDQMKSVQIVLDSHIESGRDRAFLLIAPDVQVLVGPAIGQSVDEPGVSVETEDDVLVPGEEGIVVCVAQPMRMLARGLQLHQIDDIDYPDFQIG